MKRGDIAKIHTNGEELRAMVTLASPNGKSLIVMFDGMVDQCIGMLALSQEDDGRYTNLITGHTIDIREESHAS